MGALKTHDGLIMNLVAYPIVDPRSNSLILDLHRVILRSLYGLCGYFQSAQTESKKSAGQPLRGSSRGSSLIRPYRIESTTRVDGKWRRKTVGSLALHSTQFAEHEQWTSRTSI